jgi:EAL domain-containing protein (putative c-di-GMP-specific phosphodiesterase class I)
LEALEQDALHLVFQPIVTVSSAKAHHYEVLVRMVEHNGTLIEPGTFIPAAEQFGLIQRVDRQIITKAIRRLADLPGEMRDVGFSINLSGLSVGRQDTFELIEQEIRECGVDPARITFEITETAACEQLNSAVEFIQKIRQLGCLVALDDFGVGFSSFSYLKHLRADILKIDGSFIRDIHNNKADFTTTRRTSYSLKHWWMSRVAWVCKPSPNSWKTNKCSSGFAVWAWTMCRAIIWVNHRAS